MSSNFRFISYNEDVDEMLQQILNNEEDWGYVARLNNIGGDLDPYGFMPMTMAVLKHKDEDPKNAEGLERTALYAKYKNIKLWLKKWGIRKTARAAFFRLQTMSSVGRHVDEGTYYLDKDRYHLCLQGEYDYECGGEWHTIKPGTFFWFDNKKPHQAHNYSETIERISFVFDVPKSDKNP